MRRKQRKLAEVVDLAEARAIHKLAAYRQKIAQLVEANRRAIGRLYTTGALFSHEGASAGRDLLLAHQHLLRVMKLLHRLGRDGDIPAPKKPAQLNAVFRELDELLEHTTELTSRSGQFLARLMGE